MAVAYPTQLPAPLLRSYQSSADDNIIRTPMDSGPAKQRRKYSNRQETYQIEWRFSAGQFVAFKAWYRWRIDDGESWFDINLPDGGGTFVREVRFEGTYSAAQESHDSYVVTAVVRAREVRTLTEAALNRVLSTADFDPADFDPNDFATT